jgi:uncharacterized protein DUF3455
MMTKIQSNYTGTIVGGPALSAADTLEADAYEKINVDVPDGTDVTVELMPAVPDALQLLIVKPDKGGLANLTFKVNDAAGVALPLDHPQIFSGTAGLLAKNPIEKLLFSNASGSAVNVDIALARHAIVTSGDGPGSGQPPPRAPMFVLDVLHPGAAELAITQDKVPQGIRVDETTYKLVSKRLAAGVQVYDWDPQAHAWKAPEPEADLYDADTGVQQGMHFVTDVPVWADVDGSRIMRTGDATPADPPSDLGDPNRDIAWLRVPTGPGNVRGGILKDVTIVQRLLTRYGKAPAVPPSSAPPTAPVHVHYNALYLFWAKKN